jgi:hypothetical protein
LGPTLYIYKAIDRHGNTEKQTRPPFASARHWNTAISWIFDWFAAKTILFDMVFAVAPIHDAL